MKTIMHMLMIIRALIIVATTMSECAEGDDSYWPSFGCHPFNNTAVHRNAIKHSRVDWYSCREPYDKWNGACPHVCVMLNTNVLIRSVKNGPFNLDINAFLTLFAEELGFYMDKPIGEPYQGLIAKVKAKLDNCKSNHPEYATLSVKDTPCEHWDNIIHCIDKAVGCGSMIVSRKS